MEQPHPPRKTVALIAHDNCKPDLLEWARFNRQSLRDHRLVATGTTGSILGHELDLEIACLNSGPLGGDLQIGALVAERAIDLMFFFWDPLQQQAHDPDVKALLRIATLCNIPVACNRATADHLISSPLASSAGYEQRRADHVDADAPLRPDTRRLKVTLRAAHARARARARAQHAMWIGLKDVSR